MKREGIYKVKKNGKKKRLGLKLSIIAEVLIVLVIAGKLVSEGSKHAGPINENAEIIQLTDLELKELSKENIKDTDELLLVNSSHPLKNKSYQNSIVSAYQKIALSRSDIEMGKTALNNIKEMFSAAKENGITDLVVTSGYRTYKKQSLLYEKAKDKSYVAKPGCSEHETGLAADIQLTRGGMETLGETTEGKWLEKNAQVFGFILRYPKDKEHITGISYESWHFRYVGHPHAEYIKLKNLCLEEYIDYLKSGNQYAINSGNTSYQVYRTTAKNGKIKVPKNLKYTISNDNCGGYIISVILN